MGIFFGNLFWGILVILIGASIILKSFGVRLPLVSTFIAFIIIMFGFKILIGAYRKPSQHGIQAKKSSSTHLEYTTVFGSGTADLRDLNPNITSVEVSAVFGSSTVILPDNIDFELETNAVFGAVTTPSKTDEILSSSRQSIGSGPRRVRVEATADFGRVVFLVRKGMEQEAEIVVEEPAESGF